ncbi:hypothetical protein BB561_004009 [Smittium simulii]|uniref:Uncharacterized protein n=1 Tax=Smittium simulii TaxID=133385 RepID=A0A2T9YII5_9FUNG|nr:hypothetical protein BB561_004009 [Smittium simulii]
MMTMNPEQMYHSDTNNILKARQNTLFESYNNSNSKDLSSKIAFPKLRISSNGETNAPSETFNSDCTNSTTFNENCFSDFLLNKLNDNKSSKAIKNSLKAENKITNDSNEQLQSLNRRIFNQNIRFFADPDSNETINIDPKLLKIMRNKSMTLKKSYSVDSLAINDSRKHEDSSYFFAQELAQNLSIARGHEQLKILANNNTNSHQDLGASLNNNKDNLDNVTSFTDLKTNAKDISEDTSKIERGANAKNCKDDQRMSRFLPTLNKSNTLLDMNNMLDTMFPDQNVRPSKAEKTLSKHLFGGPYINKTKSCLFLNEYLRVDEDHIANVQQSTTEDKVFELDPKITQEVHENVASFLNNFKSSWLLDSDQKYEDTLMQSPIQPFSISDPKVNSAKNDSANFDSTYSNSARSSFSKESVHNFNRNHTLSQTKDHSIRPAFFAETPVTIPKRAYFVKNKPTLDRPNSINLEISKHPEPKTSPAKEFVDSSLLFLSAAFTCLKRK